MKKKNLKAFVIMLVLSAGLGTSYAYLTASDSLDNLFDVSEVNITVKEDFIPESPEPGKRIKKAPRVHSDSDTGCYVRMRYAFTSSDAEALCEPVKINSGWTLKGDGYYYWNGVVAPGEDTSALFDYVQVKNGITQNDMIPFDILIYAEAVQSKGLEEEEAWSAMN